MGDPARSETPASIAYRVAVVCKLFTTPKRQTKRAETDAINKLLRIKCFVDEGN